MTTVEVVFVGLCALIFDKPMKATYNSAGKQPESRPFEALLPDAPGHDAEMWIPCLDLEGGCGAARGLGTCADPAQKCVAWADRKVSPSTCKDEENIYAAWCLEESRVKFLPHKSSKSTFQGGHRGKPGVHSNRHFKNKRPLADADAKDLSWVAEPNKAFGAGFLKSDPRPETRVEGLKGELRAAVVPGKEKEWDKTDIWGWCIPTYQGLEMTECKPAIGNESDYDQMLAEAAAVEIKLKTAIVEIEHRGISTNVVLDADRAKPRVYIQNIPGHAGLTEATGSTDKVCVAEHFKYYADLLNLKDSERKNVRLPFRKKTGDSCSVTSLHGSGAGDGHRLVTDSFCPPGGISRSPGG